MLATRAFLFSGIKSPFFAYFSLADADFCFFTTLNAWKRVRKVSICTSYSVQSSSQLRTHEASPILFIQSPQHVMNELLKPAHFGIHSNSAIMAPISLGVVWHTRRQKGLISNKER